MGEKVEKKNETAAPAPADGGGKKEEGPATVVLKMDLHCEGCAKKVRRSISHFEGVEKVKTDCGSSKLTVTGNVDPAWLREKVEIKTKKKVELISPPPKKDGAAAGDKKPEEKKAEDKKAEEKKPKEAVVSTVVMNIKLHCDGCAHKIKRLVLKNIDGVKSVTSKLDKNLVTVSGTMDPKELTFYLQEKLKQQIVIVPPAKKDEGGGGDKKDKEGGGDKAKEAGGGKVGDGEKKEKEGGGGDKVKEGGGDKKEKEAELKAGGGDGKKGDEKKFEVNKMEIPGYNPQTLYAMPMNMNMHMHMPPMYNRSYTNQDYGLMMHPGHGNTSTSYGQKGYAVQYSNGPPPPPPTYIDDQMFSDENPNGCSVM